MEAETKVGAQS